MAILSSKGVKPEMNGLTSGKEDQRGPSPDPFGDLGGKCSCRAGGAFFSCRVKTISRLFKITCRQGGNAGDLQRGLSPVFK